MEHMEANAPAPWYLTGRGYVLVYRFPQAFGREHSPHGTYQGGFGVMMLVDYATSNVGPYKEVLFVPGIVKLPQSVGYSISRIYVSTMESVVNGQMNWGIPKDVASFRFTQIDRHTERIQVQRDDSHPFLDITLRAGGLPIPLIRGLLPKLHQQREDRGYITALTASGVGQLGRVVQATTHGDDFPPIEQFKPMLVMRVNQFRMTFPVADVRHNHPVTTS